MLKLIKLFDAGKKVVVRRSQERKKIDEIVKTNCSKDKFFKKTTKFEDYLIMFKIFSKLESIIHGLLKFSHV